MIFLKSLLMATVVKKHFWQYSNRFYSTNTGQYDATVSNMYGYTSNESIQSCKLYIKK